jgi:hypothetical protein
VNTRAFEHIAGLHIEAAFKEWGNPEALTEEEGKMKRNRK